MRRILSFIALSFALAAKSAEPTQQKLIDLTELPLESLMNLEVPKVYAASKVEQKTTEAPASVTLVTADEIKKQGYRTLGDVLRSVAGFNVSYDRNYDFLGIRGLSLGDFNDRSLLLVDGHRVNNNYNDGAAIGTDFILDVDLVDRVEVIRGPGSVLYGNNAFFGVVNVITREGRQLQGLEASGSYGSFDARQARVTYGNRFTNGPEVLVSGSYYKSDGQDELFYKEFNTPAQNNGVANNIDGDEAWSSFGSVRYLDFKLEGGYNRREKSNPTAQFATTFNDSALKTTDDRAYADLNFAHSFPEVVDTTARVYYDYSRHEIDYPFRPIVYHEEDPGQWWGAELQVSKRLFDRHTLKLGAEYRDDFEQNSKVSDQTNTVSNIHTNRSNYGVYFEGDIAMTTNFHVIGGVRYDQYGDFDPAIDPRVALIYNPWEQSTFKAIYGTAFRAPSFYETSTSTRPLEPEEITSYELVYEQGIGKHLRSSLSGFYNDMSDLIVFDSGTFRNFDADTKGVEVSLDGSWASGIRGRASYSFQVTHDSSIAWDVPDSPNHLIKLSLIAPLVPEKLFAGLEVQYTSSRRSLHNTTDPLGQPLTVQGAEAGGFALVNFTLFSQKLIKNLELSASIYNLFDKRYSDPASGFHTQDLLEQNGRTFRVKLTYRL